MKRLEGSWPNLLMEMWHSQTKTQWEGVREEEWSLRKDCEGRKKGDGKRERRQGGERLCRIVMDSRHTTHRHTTHVCACTHTHTVAPSLLPMLSLGA